jgi:hypothetical protein
MSGDLDEEPLEYLDLGGKELKKIPVAAPNHYNVTTLSLNHNELQRLENIETYGNLLKVSSALPESSCSPSCYQSKKGLGKKEFSNEEWKWCLWIVLILTVLVTIRK